jgi:hypothetical protein
MFLPALLPPWSEWSVCLLLANALVAILSWIPMTLSGQPNDCRLLIDLVRTPAEFAGAVRELWVLDCAGVWPRDWPAGVISKLAQATYGEAYLIRARQFVYTYVRDRGDPTEIAAALELVLAGAKNLPPDTRRGYFVEAAFYQGAVARNGTLAREWLEDARKVKGALPSEDWECYPYGRDHAC